MASKKHHISSYELAEHLNESLDLLKHELQALRGNTNTDELNDIEHNIVQQLEHLKRDASILTNQPIRTIHHLACTGGTLISKCIAALPNVQLLSEVDPLSTLQDSGKPMFGPTDLIKQWRQGSRGASQDDIIELFLAEMKVILNAATRVGQNVVIRDHSHSHFNSGPDIPERPTIRQILQRAFDVKSVVTVRHPADSYASLVKNGWHTHFQPADFEEYCKRYLIFLGHYQECVIIKYEKFIKNSIKEMESISGHLNLSFNKGFMKSFYSVKITGDSGNKRSTISTESIRKKINFDTGFESYEKLCEFLHYIRIKDDNEGA